MKTMFDKRSAVIHTSEHCKVGVVIFERIKVNGMSIKISQYPALLLSNKSYREKD